MLNSGPNPERGNSTSAGNFSSLHAPDKKKPPDLAVGGFF
jgi:hypothetical protein